jgi:uncharacterized membrane protein YfcA
VLALVLALAVVVGLTMGLLGGGGSILLVPLLVYVAGMDPKEAIVTSLLVVGVTAIAAVIGHARAGRVRWRTGLIFGAAGMAGAFGGGLIGGYLPGEILLLAFALMMVATAIAMLRGRKKKPGHAHTELPVFRVVLDGAVVGLVTGLVGAGGGFLVVPALALLGGLSMPVAVGTSLLVIAMKSFAGVAGYLATVEVDWAMVGAITGAAVVGTILGGLLIARIPADSLRRAFGWFVLAMGAFVLVQQVPADWRVPSIVAVGVLAAAIVACLAFVPRCPLRERRETTAPAATAPAVRAAA